MTLSRLSRVALVVGMASLTGCAAAGGDSAEGGFDGETFLPEAGRDAPADLGSPSLDSPTFDASSSGDTGTKPDAGPPDTGPDVGGDSAGDTGKTVPEAGADGAKDAAPDVSTSDATIPTTCAEADKKIGCCVGNVVYYCATTLTSKACTGSDVCGWDKSKSYYTCVPPPGGADPSGTYPIACK